MVASLAMYVQGALQFMAFNLAFVTPQDVNLIVD